MYDTIFLGVEHIKYYAETLLSGKHGQMSEKQVQFLERILSSSQIFCALLKDFQHMSTVESKHWDDVAKLRHDLRNPITPLLAYSELMLLGKTGPITPEQYKDLNSIFTAACTIRDLVNEITEESRQLQAIHQY